MKNATVARAGEMVRRPVLEVSAPDEGRMAPASAECIPIGLQSGAPLLAARSSKAAPKRRSVVAGGTRTVL